MKKTMISGLAVSVMALASAVANAGDDLYPAANFQPKVIYQDESVTSSTTHAHPQVMADAKYPAAYFQPKVIYPEGGKIAKVKQEAAFDPNYPAAYFQPKVIYP